MNDPPLGPAGSVGDARRPPQPFREVEMVRWGWRRLRDALRRSIHALKPTDYRNLARFADDLRTWYCSGSDTARGLEMCVKSVRTTAFGKRWATASDRVREGASLTDALSNASDYLPEFFLPVIDAGEKAGRLDDALAFVANHCRLLAGPASAIRNVWLYPLAIMIFGSLLKIFIFLAMGSLSGAFSMLIGELFSWLQLAVVVMILIATPARYYFEQLCLQFPIIGQLQREIAMNRFFRTMALVYGVGGHRVEMMIHTAAKAVSNTAIRAELLKAADGIEQKQGVTEAFRVVDPISDEEKSTIEIGEMSGKLEQAFDAIADKAEASMLPKLRTIQSLSTKVLMYAVMMSLAGTMLSILLSTR
ncbi:MAG: hypothetical protein HKN47_24650 [Pirellulaceae bacterium]|nr:hypothetical protein [Pirellulaceae bacterium]